MPSWSTLGLIGLADGSPSEQASPSRNADVGWVAYNTGPLRIATRRESGTKKYISMRFFPLSQNILSLQAFPDHYNQGRPLSGDLVLVAEQGRLVLGRFGHAGEPSFHFRHFSLNEDRFGYSAIIEAAPRAFPFGARAQRLRFSVVEKETGEHFEFGGQYEVQSSNKEPSIWQKFRTALIGPRGSWGPDFIWIEPDNENTPSSPQ